MVFYSSDLENAVYNLHGTEFGAKFGYAMASGDIDNNGITDLVVSAPMASVKNPKRPKRDIVSAGKVFIYFGIIIQTQVLIVIFFL